MPQYIVIHRPDNKGVIEATYYGPFVHVEAAFKLMHHLPKLEDGAVKQIAELTTPPFIDR